MAKHGKTGFARINDATRHSIKGLIAAWINESAFRQQVSLMLFLVPAAFWLGENATEIALLIGSCLIVIVAELLNSAVESAIDRISLEHHPLSGQAKDLGSAAVFVAIGFVVISWGLIAYERFY